MIGAPPARLLLVSLGSIGRRHLRNARALAPGAEIAVLRTKTADASAPAGADKVVATLEAAVDWRPDAVIVSSPAPTHLAYATPFLERGASVFVEKPLSADLEGVAAFERRAAEAAGFVMVGYVLRFSPALNAARAALAQGRIGRPLLARIEVGQYLPDWRPASDYRAGVSAQRALGGGALLELSHEIDYALWLLGAPDGVTARIEKLSDLDIDVEDSATLMFDYAAPKRIATLHLDFLQRVPQLGLQVIGTNGTFKADLMAEKALVSTPDTPEGASLETYVLADGNEIYLRQFDLFFYKALANYAPRFAETRRHDAWADVASAARVMRVIDAARRSSAAGARVALGA